MIVYAVYFHYDRTLSMKKNSPKGILFLFSAAIVWGGAFVAQTMASEISPMFFNACRFLIGAVVLIPVFLLFEKKTDDRKKMKRTFVTGVIAGALLCTASYLQQVGINLTDAAGKSGFITGLYMILVPIIGIFFGRGAKWFSWVAALLGVIGMFLICMADSKMTFTLGDGFLVLCAIAFSFHIIVIDRFGQNIYSLRFSSIQFATSSVIGFIFAFIFEPVGLEPIVLSLVPILYCGILSTGVGYTCQVLGQKFTEPTSSAIILSTEAVFSAIFGALLINERMSIPAYIGCALIFAGIIVSQLDQIIKHKT